jgi:hypothetical protein
MFFGWWNIQYSSLFCFYEVALTNLFCSISSQREKTWTKDAESFYQGSFSVVWLKSFGKLEKYCILKKLLFSFLGFLSRILQKKILATRIN